MNKKKVITGIVGAMLVAGCTAAASYFPHLVGILTASSALITAAIAYVNGEDNSEE